MRIEHIYRPEPLICRPEDDLGKAARIMRNTDVGTLAVCEEGRLDRLVGIISERDLVQAVADAADLRTRHVRAYTSTGAYTADLAWDSWTVGNRMLNLGIRHIPITSKGTVVGMISMRDLVAAEALA